MNTRRDFLRQAAGLSVLVSGCSRVDVPGWLDAALRRLREQDAPGLVFRLPADPDGRCALGHAIARHLINSTDPDVLEVLSEAPLICLDSPVIQNRFRGVRASDTLILIDGDGYAIDGLVFEPGEQWANFVPAARALMHGPGGRRLAERAERLRAVVQRAADLPYGIETTAQVKGGCGICGCEEAPPRSAAPCGMAIAVKNSRYFIKFLKR